MFMDPFGSYDAFSGIFSIIFILILGIILFAIIRGIREWHSNNQAPRLVVDAEVVSKRTRVSSDQHAAGGDPSGAHGFYTTTSTRYYVTFEVESTDRMEFSVSGSEYGRLAEGDYGKLSFQGTRYRGFEKKDN